MLIFIEMKILIKNHKIYQKYLLLLLKFLKNFYFILI